MTALNVAVVIVAALVVNALSCNAIAAIGAWR